MTNMMCTSHTPIDSQSNFGRFFWRGGLLRTGRNYFGAGEQIPGARPPAIRFKPPGMTITRMMVVIYVDPYEGARSGSERKCLNS